LILNTDMALMKDLRGQLKAYVDKHQIKDGKNLDKIIDNSCVMSTENSKTLISISLIHAADISTSIRPFEMSEIWAGKLFEEFFN